MQQHHNLVQGEPFQILTLLTYALLSCILPNAVNAQSHLSTQKPTTNHTQHSVTTRKIIRLGTAIPPDSADNSTRINSEDAGPILPYRSYSGCMNCGMMEMYPLNYGHTMQAITGGIIGGTIANKVGKRFDVSPRYKTERLLGNHTDTVAQPSLNKPFQ